MRYLTFALGLAAAAVAAKGDRAPLETVDRVNLERYTGRWYEVARLPNRFQDDCVSDVTAHYSLLPEGKIAVQNACIEKDGELNTADGEARVVDDSNAKLEVRFAPKWLSWLPQVWGDYWILELDEEYRWAVVGEPKREYFWILSRTPTLDEDVILERIRRAEAQGYDLENLIRTRHSNPVSEAR